MFPGCHFSIGVAILHIPKKEHHVLIHLDDLFGHNRQMLSQMCHVWSPNDHFV